MKTYLLALSAFFAGYTAIAQAPEDVLRYSFFPPTGSARNMAIGGAMGSLGGDISALYSNPAGLGLYKTQEFVVSPGFNLNNNKFDFRGTNQTANKSAFNLGTTGFVGGFNTPNSKWTSQAVSIGVNRTANFNNVVSYKGLNDYSSYTEQFTEEIRNSGLQINQVLNNPAYAFGSAPALYTYLVDTFRTNNGLELRGLPEFLLDSKIALSQEKRVETSGGITELAFGYAANMDDKFYIGGTLGIPIVNYSRYTYYKESDPSGNGHNNFNYFELKDNLTTKGLGLNAKFGIIVKPQDFIRLGLTVHTPTYYSLTDHQSSDLTADTEGFNGVANAKSSVFTGGRDGSTKYTALSPWKAVVSGSYVFREINDTRRQRAFLTADVEYVGYAGSHFGADGNNISQEDIDYYKDMRTVIKSYYKNAFNFRLGGELKFNTWMFRAGTAFYGNPYDKTTNLKANKTLVSGGVGYRDHGIFIDLTYVHNINKDVNFPYRLEDKANTYAMQTGSTGNVMLTFGIKL